MGLHLIKTEKRACCRTMIGTDNQAAIKAVHKELSTPTHILAKDTLRSAKQISKSRGNRRYILTIRWTAGHMGLEGNEKVDEEAKKAAKGQSTTSSLLPNVLRRKLKFSTAALKQRHNMLTKSSWKKSWDNSTRGKRDHLIDLNSPSKHFINLISNHQISRQVTSLISLLKPARIGAAERPWKRPSV